MRRFSASDSVLNGRGNWKLRARPSRVRSCADRPSSVCPAKRTLPVSLRSVPHMQFTNVLLPEPLGPIRPTRSPSRTASSIACKATKPPKRLPRSVTSSSATSVTGRRLPPRNRSSPRIPFGATMTNPTSIRPTINRFSADDIVTVATCCSVPSRTAPITGPEPARSAAHQRHRHAVHRIGQAEAGRRVEIRHVVRQWRAGHAHERTGQCRRHQLQPQRRHARCLGRDFVVTDRGEAHSPDATVRLPARSRARSPRAPA